MSQSTTGTIAEHGVPDGAGQALPTGLPTSDRHHSETAAGENGGDASAAKHDHGKQE